MRDSEVRILAARLPEFDVCVPFSSLLTSSLTLPAVPNHWSLMYSVSSPTPRSQTDAISQERTLPLLARHCRQRLLGSSSPKGVCLHGAHEELGSRVVGWRAGAPFLSQSAWTTLTPDRTQLWSTALKNGLRSAVLMWPGPPIMKDGAKPSLWCAASLFARFRRSPTALLQVPFPERLSSLEKGRQARGMARFVSSSSSSSLRPRRLTSRADLPLKSRPHLITAYAPEVDQEGHRTGPHSAAINETLLEMDAFAKGLFVEIEKRNLTDVVDVIFVSDHGMTE